MTGAHCTEMLLVLLARVHLLDFLRWNFNRIGFAGAWVGRLSPLSLLQSTLALRSVGLHRLSRGLVLAHVLHLLHRPRLQRLPCLLLLLLCL